MTQTNLTLYNTRTGTRETFTPLVPGHVHMYACGPTTYDSAHLGHARSAIAFDVLYRVLIHLGTYHVNYIRNFTDVDDKIIARAQELGEDPFALSARYAEQYVQDMTDLGALLPNVQPKVTENIGPIIDYVQKLIENGHAYAAEGNVYFAIDSFPDYGKLSGRDTESMLAGQRVDVDFLKRNPLDFALWKRAKEGEPFWESPWGPGRPGWHIECSAMSGRFGAPTLDIHGGGRDLLFPHHENEVAQSECVHKTRFANYWVHNGFVNVGAEKMSKSLRNFITVREILDRVPRAAVRTFLLGSQYRSVLEFTWPSLMDALKATERFYHVRGLTESLAATGGHGRDPGLDDLLTRTQADIRAALLDDLNTPVVVATLHEYCTQVNRWLDAHPKANQRSAAADTWRDHAGLWQTLNQWTGLCAQSTDEFRQELSSKGAQALGISPDRIAADIAARAEARIRKDWAAADTLRQSLLAQGVQLQDGPQSTSWSVDVAAYAARLSEL